MGRKKKQAAALMDFDKSIPSVETEVLCKVLREDELQQELVETVK